MKKYKDFKSNCSFASFKFDVLWHDKEKKFMGICLDPPTFAGEKFFADWEDGALIGIMNKICSRLYQKPPESY